MSRLTSFATILVAWCGILTGAQAQNAYRCGNSYSQSPCPGGVPVEVDDSRSKAQKSQSESVIKRDLRTADTMEKNRLRQEEARQRAAKPVPEKPAAKANAPAPAKATPSTKKRPSSPAYFTAKTTPDQKKKKSDTVAPTATTTGNTNTSK